MRYANTKILCVHCCRNNREQKSSLRESPPDTEFFVPKYLAYHTVQTNSDRGKISKNLKLGFFGPLNALILS